MDLNGYKQYCSRIVIRRHLHATDTNFFQGWLCYEAKWRGATSCSGLWAIGQRRHSNTRTCPLPWATCRGIKAQWHCSAFLFVTEKRRKAKLFMGGRKWGEFNKGRNEEGTTKCKIVQRQNIMGLHVLFYLHFFIFIAHVSGIFPHWLFLGKWTRERNSPPQVKWSHYKFFLDIFLKI